MPGDKSDNTGISVFFRIMSGFFNFPEVPAGKNRGNHEKTGRYVTALSFSFILPQTEWKNTFRNLFLKCSNARVFFLKIYRKSAILMTSSPNKWRHQNNCCVSMFLIWWASIVLSFIIIATPSQKLCGGGGRFSVAIFSTFIIIIFWIHCIC